MPTNGDVSSPLRCKCALGNHLRDGARARPGGSSAVAPSSAAEPSKIERTKSWTRACSSRWAQFSQMLRSATIRGGSAIAPAQKNSAPVAAARRVRPRSPRRWLPLAIFPPEAPEEPRLGSDEPRRGRQEYPLSHGDHPSGRRIISTHSLATNILWIFRIQVGTLGGCRR